MLRIRWLVQLLLVHVFCATLHWENTHFHFHSFKIWKQQEGQRLMWMMTKYREETKKWKQFLHTFASTYFHFMKSRCFPPQPFANGRFIILSWACQENNKEKGRWSYRGTICNQYTTVVCTKTEFIIYLFVRMNTVSALIPAASTLPSHKQAFASLQE